MLSAAALSLSCARPRVPGTCERTCRATHVPTNRRDDVRGGVTWNTLATELLISDANESELAVPHD